MAKNIQSFFIILALFSLSACNDSTFTSNSNITYNNNGGDITMPESGNSSNSTDASSENAADGQPNYLVSVDLCSDACDVAETIITLSPEVGRNYISVKIKKIPDFEPGTTFRLMAKSKGSSVWHKLYYWDWPSQSKATLSTFQGVRFSVVGEEIYISPATGNVLDYQTWLLETDDKSPGQGERLLLGEISYTEE